MPKTYQTPDPRQESERNKEPERESKSRKTVGVYGQPGGTTRPTRGLMLALAAILGLLIIFMLYRMARGGEPEGSVKQFGYSGLSSHQVVSQTHYSSAIRR